MEDEFVGHAMVDHEWNQYAENDRRVSKLNFPGLLECVDLLKHSAYCQVHGKLIGYGDQPAILPAVEGIRTHLGVILQSQVVQSGEDANSYECPVGPVDHGEDARIVLLISPDSMDAICNCASDVH